MAALQNFRSALNGFNREDVVHYIEYINNLHAAELNQMTTQLQALQEELSALREQPREEAMELQAQLDAATDRCDALEQELAQVREELGRAQQEAARPQTEEELEAYRRAERMERVAGERVSQLYQQANGVLADATVRVDEAAVRVCELADQVTVQLAQLQTAVLTGKNSLKDAAAAMYAIRPIPEE